MAFLGSSLARWSKFTVAKAMRPSRDSARAPAALYGLITPVTCGMRATRASMGAIRARTAGSLTLPCLAANTIWSLSPAWAGKSRLRRSVARWDSVPGSEKLVA
jgi:hypothetical protein